MAKQSPSKRLSINILSSKSFLSLQWSLDIRRLTLCRALRNNFNATGVPRSSPLKTPANPPQKMRLGSIFGIFTPDIIKDLGMVGISDTILSINRLALWLKSNTSVLMDSVRLPFSSNWWKKYEPHAAFRLCENDKRREQNQATSQPRHPGSLPALKQCQYNFPCIMIRAGGRPLLYLLLS